MIWRRWEHRRPTGIDRVCLAYLDHFGPDAQAVVQHRRLRRIFDQESSARLFEVLRSEKKDFRQALIKSSVRLSLRRSCPGAGRIYLNIGHTGLDSVGFRTWLGGADVRPVYFVHDLIPITHPEYCRDGEQAKHVERMRTVLASANGVIANSQATLDELKAFASARQLPFPMAMRALLGTTPLEFTAQAVDTVRPTFIVLGTIEGRKNHLMLLRIWRRLVERKGEGAPLLLLVGQRGWECGEALEILDTCMKLKEAVVELRHCDDESLAEHLASSRALLFPSMVEGYGLPLVEALQAGTPVIASDLRVFREIAGEIPDYLDPLDEDAWERRILEYAAKASPAREAQLRRMGDYQAPAWSDHFAAVKIWLKRFDKPGSAAQALDDPVDQGGHC